MKKVMFALAVCLLLAGCHRPEIQPGSRVVTMITVTRSDGTCRCYTAEDKMRAVLTYLRGLDPYGPAERPPMSGSEYEIDVLYSDGNGTHYALSRDPYLQVDSASWQALDPDKAAGLAEIFEATPSD